MFNLTKTSATLALLAGLTLVPSFAQTGTSEHMSSEKKMAMMDKMSPEDKAAMLDKMPSKEKMAMLGKMNSMNGHDTSSMSSEDKMAMMDKMHHTNNMKDDMKKDKMDH